MGSQQASNRAGLTEIHFEMFEWYVRQLLRVHAMQNLQRDLQIWS